ncbi:hypothetical protein TNCV_2031451 [Trichonephila clavipes]|nr:hypothetical protein TNCV_2031451 [Trichonephila clavipes]
MVGGKRGHLGGLQPDQGCYLSKLGGTEPNRTINCMVRKATANDRRREKTVHSCVHQRGPSAASRFLPDFTSGTSTDQQLLPEKVPRMRLAETESSQEETRFLIEKTFHVFPLEKAERNENISIGGKPYRMLMCQNYFVNTVSDILCRRITFLEKKNLLISSIPSEREK